MMMRPEKRLRAAFHEGREDGGYHDAHIINETVRLMERDLFIQADDETDVAAELNERAHDAAD